MIRLYPHQEKAVQDLSNGKILWGRVGIGKSVTALAYYYERVCQGVMGDPESMRSPRDVYVITTAKKRDDLDWIRDAGNFGITEDRSEHPQAICITVDSWNNIGKYVGVKDAFFIFDEQRVVGSGAWTKHFIKIAQDNEWILLSGTPGDTWLDYIPVFVANGFYKNRTEFKREHVIYNNFSKFPKVDRYTGIAKLQKLRNEVLVHMEYGRTTERIGHTIIVPHDVPQLERITRDRWNPFDEKPLKNVSELFSTARRSVNTHPSRMEALSTILEKHQKLIVFYNFNYELEILRRLAGYWTEDDGRGELWIRDNELEVAEWNGHKHEPVPTGEKWVYLVQYAAGSEGWNCVETDAILFYSQTYSYKMFEQAHGRIDRLNTPFRDLHYYYLRSRGWIDGAITKSLNAKENFNESSYMANSANFE